MDSALGWIGQLIEWLGRFFPRWFLLDATEGAVKYVGSFGKAPLQVIACGPGIHWYWPVTSSVVNYPTSRQTDNMPAQTFATRDDKTIAVGGLLVYEVIDVVKLVSTTHRPMIAIQDIALGAVHDVCCNMEWAELKDAQRRGTLDTKLRNAAQKQLTDYGVRVVKCMLTDLAQTRVLKVIQSVSQETL